MVEVCAGVSRGVAVVKSEAGVEVLGVVQVQLTVVEVLVDVLVETAVGVGAEGCVLL